MPIINVDVGIGDAIKLVDSILARRNTRKEAVWEDLRDDLDAISAAVDAVDNLYAKLLGEIEDILRSREPSSDRIADAVREGHAFLHHPGLLNRLQRLHGSVHEAAFSRKLKGRRYRELATALRTLDSRLDSHIAQLRSLQRGSQRRSQAPPRLGLRESLDAIEAVLQKGPEEAPKAAFVCEEAIRNYDYDLGGDISTLVGRVRKQLSLKNL